VIVLDIGPIDASKATKTALAARAHWLTVECLPKYAPELNEIENAWRNLKANHLAHQTFAHAHALDTAIHHAAALNAERAPDPLANLRIPA
jgi:transposase